MLVNLVFGLWLMAFDYCVLVLRIFFSRTIMRAICDFSNLKLRINVAHSIKLYNRIKSKTLSYIKGNVLLVSHKLSCSADYYRIC